MKLAYWCLILALVITCFGYADLIHVPGDQPTIQAGIDAAVDGDTVLVANGMYTGLGNKNLDFGGKAITVTSENGADNCIIDCEGDGRGCYFHNRETEASVVSGFTITNGSGVEGGGIACENSSPTIENNIIKYNSVSDDGGGIWCLYSSPTITNSTITRNSTDWSGGIHCSDSSPTITNTILWNNSSQEIFLTDSSITVTYSDIQGGWEGEGNINADPLFVDPDNGDYHLQAGSPCIDAGDPNSTKDPDGTRADMGAYYFDQSAPLPGDVSGNGSITADDASLVLQSVVGLVDLSERQKIAADVTGDGKVTALDAALILQDTVGLITQFPVQQGAPVLTAKDENQMLTKRGNRREAAIRRHKPKLLYWK